jgi:phage terminase large subunit-like protein
VNAPSALAEVRGSTLPRIWTPPLVTGPAGPCGCGCALTAETSFGFGFLTFVALLGLRLRPWQRWAAIHLGELLPDGRPRFRRLLIVIARQNGKTTLVYLLILFWMFVDRCPLIVASNADRAKAKAAWFEVIEMAETIPVLAAQLPATHTRRTLSEEDFWNIHRSHYKFAAPNRRAGRAGTVHRGVLDELREHATFDAYEALYGAMTAVADAQLICITNQGSALAVVLHSLRDAAIRYITTGEGDLRLGLLEWSAPEGSAPTDVDGLAGANPALGDGILLDSLIGDAITAQIEGGDKLTGFLTEHMCIAVTLLKKAYDPQLWASRGPTPERPAIPLAEHRQRLALCVEVSIGQDHATLYGAAVIDGRVHIEPIAAWDSTKELRDELPGLVERIRPRVLGWLPNGPTAAVLAALRNPGQRRWPPRGIKLEEITSETTAVCMGFDELINSGDLHHSDDPLLNAHIDQTTKQMRVNGSFIYARLSGLPIDATYAAAGAAHLARNLPPPPPPLKIIGNP